MMMTLRWQWRSGQLARPAVVGASAVLAVFLQIPSGSSRAENADAPAANQQAALPPVTVPVRCVTCSPDGKWLATSGGPQNGPGGIHMARFSPDGKTIAGAGWDANVQLWDVASQQVVATLGQ